MNRNRRENSTKTNLCFDLRSESKGTLVVTHKMHQRKLSDDLLRINRKNTTTFYCHEFFVSKVSHYAIQNSQTLKF